MLALAQYEAGVGPCGFHKSLTGDPANHFTFEEETCSVCRGAALYDRVQKERDKATLGDKPDPKSPWPSDGRSTHIRMMTNAEVEQRRASRSRGPAVRG